MQVSILPSRYSHQNPSPSQATPPPPFAPLLLLMDPIETIVEDEEEVPVVLMPVFPGYKYHGPPLHFLTRPAMTKADYERKIWSCQ